MNHINNLSKAKFWEDHIRRSAESEGSASRYCLEQNLSKARFCYWKARLKRDGLDFKGQDQNSLQAVGFARVVVAPAAPKEVSLGGSLGLVRVRVTEFEISSSEFRSLIFGRN
jgi:hypothetical protein